MKKVFLVGILALVVVGCVLAAGCTSADKQASGTMVSDGQLAALGAAIEAKLGETSPASGCILDMKTGERIVICGPNGDIAPSPASGAVIWAREIGGVNPVIV